MMNYTYPIVSSGIGVMPKYKIVQKVVRTRETFTGSDTKELSEALADGWQVVMCHPLGECLEYIVQKMEVEEVRPLMRLERNGESGGSETDE